MKRFLSQLPKRARATSARVSVWRACPAATYLCVQMDRRTDGRTGTNTRACSATPLATTWACTGTLHDVARRPQTCTCTDAEAQARPELESRLLDCVVSLFTRQCACATGQSETQLICMMRQVPRRVLQILARILTRSPACVPVLNFAKFGKIPPSPQRHPESRTTLHRRASFALGGGAEGTRFRLTTSPIEWTATRTRGMQIIVDHCCCCCCCR